MTRLLLKFIDKCVLLLDWDWRGGTLRASAQGPLAIIALVLIVGVIAWMWHG